MSFEFALPPEPAPAKVAAQARFLALQAKNRPQRTGRPAQQTLSALPDDIAFLAFYGVKPGILLEAQQLAVNEGVLAHEALLAHDLISARLFYACLARHCQLVFHEGPVQLAASAHYPDAIHAGISEIMPTNGAQWLMAPRGEALLTLLANRPALRAQAKRFVICTPAHLSLQVQRHFQSEMSARASHDLADHHPHFSARPGVRASWRVCGIIAAIVLGVWLVAPAALQASAAFIMGGIFFVFIWLRLQTCLVANQQHDKPEPDSDAQVPLYTVIVPIYDEAIMVERLILGLTSIDYPKSRLQIILVLEACDAPTQRALAALVLPARFEILIAPPGQPRTKPRALNMALPLARGELVVVFDAEDVPQPSQLRDAAARFRLSAPEVACLQARLVIENSGESWLTRLFAMEYAALFDVINPGLAFSHVPFPLGGTSNHFKLAALQQCRGWDAWNVTEDADLGLRLGRLGYSTQTITAITLEEAPITLKAWLGQRRRWQKGWMQTALVHLSHPRHLLRDLGLLRALSCLALLGNMIVGPLLGPAFTLWTLYQASFGALLTPVTSAEIVCSTMITLVFISGYAAAILPLVLGMRRRALLALLPTLVLLPLYHCCACYAALAALVELFRAPFHWQKTAHGLTRQRAA